MSQNNIRAALVGAYEELQLGLPTAYPNKKRTPPDKGAYAALNFVPGRPFPASVGVNGSDRHTGFFQIDLYVPADTGDGFVSKLADQITAHFKPGASFTYAGQDVLIRSSGRGGGRGDGRWHVLTVTIYWTATIYRS